MSGKSNMQFRLSLNGENIDLPQIEEALHIRLNGGCIDAPKELPTNRNCPIFYEQIAWLLDLAEKNRETLIGSGVDLSRSQIWLNYAYCKQCNMEFDAALLERMGKHGSKLCISCEEV